MTLPIHVIVGPDAHGVVDYALRLHRVTGGPVVRATHYEDLPSAIAPGPLHFTFTDHLFGDSPDAAAAAVLELAKGRTWSISFHDVPQPEEGAERFAHRAPAYRRLADAATASFVNSHHEAAFFAPLDVSVLHLPLPDSAPSRDTTAHADRTGTRVGMLGFIYPGKGHDDVLRALAGTDLHLRAIGGYAAGHEHLDQDLASLAAELGVDYHATGYLELDELHHEMDQADIPVVAHRHFSASGSLMEWLSRGRRVLAADSAYTRELRELWPEFIDIVPEGHWSAAFRDVPEDFSVPRTPPRNWTWRHVARGYVEVWSGPRFDLTGNSLPPAPEPSQALTEWPSVSVVIPYYEAQDDLDAVLAGLHEQDYPGPVEIIVADDGSPTAPVVPVIVTVVRQEDKGFRAAAARNLGASVATGEILAFLDGDTVPDPGYLRAVVAIARRDPRAVVVGTRLQGDAEPAWLQRAWDATADLAAADDTSWRFIISAALTCSRDFFLDVGGFDASMVGYGGEDWEFGYRAWNAGAIFRHAPEAVARHRDPEWGERVAARDAAEAAAEKNGESVALARRITHPLARPTAVFPTADVTVHIPAWSAPGVQEAVILGWLALGDVHVSLPADAAVPALFAADPRVRSNNDIPAPATVVTEWSTSRVTVSLDAPAVPSSLDELYRVESLGGRAEFSVADASGSAAHGTIVFARRRALEARGVTTPAAVNLSVPGTFYDAPVRLERLFAGW